MKTYAFKVTLAGLKGFERVYHIGGKKTLYDFHKQMRADLEFPQDQMILFKAFDAADNVAARFGLIDLGQGAVDTVSIDRIAVEGEIVRFTYFYDVTNRKSVEIACLGEVTPGPDENGEPVIVFAKGPNPIEFENGYVAYEDLPDDQKHIHRPAASLLGDDEDFDDEDLDDEDEDAEEEDDDEDGKEIYDGSDPL